MSNKKSRNKKKKRKAKRDAGELREKKNVLRSVGRWSDPPERVEEEDLKSECNCPIECTVCTCKMEGST